MNLRVFIRRVHKKVVERISRVTPTTVVPRFAPVAANRFALQQHRQLRSRQANRAADRLRPHKTPALQPLVTHPGMQMLRFQRSVLCASLIRSTPLADGSYLAWASGTTVMG